MWQIHKLKRSGDYVAIWQVASGDKKYHIGSRTSIMITLSKLYRAKVYELMYAFDMLNKDYEAAIFGEDGSFLYVTDMKGSLNVKTV